MKLDITQPYIKHAALLQMVTTETEQRLLSEGAKIQNCYELTIADLDMLLYHPYSERRQHFNLPEHVTIQQHYWYRSFADFVQNDFVPAMQNIKIPNTYITEYEKKAQAQTFPNSFTESLLIFTRNYFNLPSFTTAEKITLAEFLLAYKDKTNQDIFQRVCNQLQLKDIRNRKR